MMLKRKENVKLIPDKKKASGKTNAMLNGKKQQKNIAIYMKLKSTNKKLILKKSDNMN